MKNKIDAVAIGKLQYPLAGQITFSLPSSSCHWPVANSRQCPLKSKFVISNIGTIEVKPSTYSN